MPMELQNEIKELNDELISLRRDFHQHPELGFEELRTARIVATYLEDLGLEVATGIARTGVVGLLRGGHPGRTLLLRADLDALPIQEETPLPYASLHAGKMHACGHDGHIAMLLVAAKVLARRKASLHGNVKFVFQPNEEDAGAALMVAEGVLEGPKVDASFGIHLWAPIPSGKVGLTSGPTMASSDYFRLRISGPGGHGGAPHETVDPVICATNVIQAVQAIQTREFSPLKPIVITFCKIHCGTSAIIIPDAIELEGSIRCLFHGAEEVHARFRAIITEICQAYRTTFHLDIKQGNALLSNDPQMTRFAREIAGTVFGADAIDSDVRLLVGDDFSEFNKTIPGVYCFIGSGNSEKATTFPHHHARFNIDEEVLASGVEMHVKVALEYLSQQA